MRVTWFGGECVRLQISDQSFCFFPESADAAFSRTAIEAGAQIIDAAQSSPFVPYEGKALATPTRLIDAMDMPDQFFSAEDGFLVRSEPDETFVLLYAAKGATSLLSQDVENAVICLVGNFNFVVDWLQVNLGSKPRQLLLALNGEEGIDIHLLAQNIGKTPVQILSFGETIEL